jgi:NitT/TauT family transport system substrate-binding protein
VDGSATFACVPSESVISYHTWPNGAKPKIVAVAALLQSNQSAIVTLKSSGIERPAQLDGKKYASYAARWVHTGSSCDAGSTCMSMDCDGLRMPCMQ